MITTYTLNQMVTLWRQRAGLTPLRTDCSIEAEDGIDVDRALTARIRQWQLHALDTAPTEMLDVKDIADLCTSRRTLQGTTEITLPDDCRRVVAVQMASWRVAVAPISAAEACASAVTLDNPYAAAAPIAIARPGKLTVYPAEASVAAILAVMDTGPETIVCDERLLDTIDVSGIIP